MKWSHFIRWLICVQLIIIVLLVFVILMVFCCYCDWYEVVPLYHVIGEKHVCLCMFFVPDDIENEIRINMTDDKITTVV